MPHLFLTQHLGQRIGQDCAATPSWWSSRVETRLLEPQFRMDVLSFPPHPSSLRRSSGHVQCSWCDVMRLFLGRRRAQRKKRREPLLAERPQSHRSPLSSSYRRLSFRPGRTSPKDRPLKHRGYVYLFIRFGGDPFLPGGVGIVKNSMCLPHS